MHLPFKPSSLEVESQKHERGHSRIRVFVKIHCELLSVELNSISTGVRGGSNHLFISFNENRSSDSCFLKSPDNLLQSSFVLNRVPTGIACEYVRTIRNQCYLSRFGF